MVPTGVPPKSSRRSHLPLLGLLGVILLLIAGGAAAVFFQAASDDDETETARPSAANSSSTSTTSTSTTTMSPPPPEFNGGWVTEYAVVRASEGQAEVDRQLADIRADDPEATAILTDEFASFLPGSWAIVNTGPWSSGIEAAEHCEQLTGADVSSCKGRFVSGDPRHRDIECSRWEGVYLPSCSFGGVHSIPSGYDGELLYGFGFWLPGPSTIVGDVDTVEDGVEGPVSTYEENFTLIVHEEGITEDDLIARLEEPPAPWELVERIPGDQGRAGPGFRYEHALPCGNHPCIYELSVQIHHPQGSAQLQADEDYGVSEPWVLVSAFSG